jgi:predicted RNA-binding Zn ribbon-like protein
MSVRHEKRRPPQFDLIAGGVVCLDFINTLDSRSSAAPKELLPSFADLARFAEDTEILAPTEVGELVERSQSNSGEAHKTLRAAIELREALFAIFTAILEQKPIPASPLAELNQHVRDAAQHTHLVPGREHFESRFEQPETFDAVLWPLARSAAELLTSDQLQFVRACSLETCQWFFLDTSKNHRRRWCKMDLCGNRAKAQRFYARKKRAARKSKVTKA